MSTYNIRHSQLIKKANEIFTVDFFNMHDVDFFCVLH